MMLDRLPQVRRAPIQYGVATPDIFWRIDGPDTPKALVCDAGDMQLSFATYVERIVDHWQQWHRSQGWHVAGLNSANRASVVDLLRGDFDLRPSLSAQMGLVDTELLRLTEQQYRTLEGLRLNDRAVVSGGAGTGKTLLALNEAEREAGRGRKVLLTCFNRRLADHLAKTSRDVKGVTVLHLHGLMAELIRRAHLESKLPDADESSLLEVFYPELAAEAVFDLEELGCFGSLVVDEGQDLLLNPYLDLLDYLLADGLSGGRWRVFLDHRQNLFDGSEPAALGRLWEHSPARFELTVNCRNTTPIAVATSLFAETPIDELSDVDGPDVVERWFEEPSQQIELLASSIDDLLAGNIRLDQVVVLSRRRLANSGIPRSLPNGIVLWEAGQPKPSRPHVEFSTIASFKGLERDVVILVGIDDLSGDNARVSLYVGLSRAKGVLVPFVSESQRKRYRELAELLGRRYEARHPAGGV